MGHLLWHSHEWACPFLGKGSSFINDPALMIMKDRCSESLQDSICLLQWWISVMTMGQPLLHFSLVIALMDQVLARDVESIKFLQTQKSGQFHRYWLCTMTDKSIWRMISQISAFVGFAADQKELRENHEIKVNPLSHGIMACLTCTWIP